jgi:ATP synthase protein I
VIISVAIEKNGLPAAVRSLLDVGNFGLTVGAAILLGYYLGSYLDRRFGTEPWLLLGCVLLFMVGAFVKFFRSIQGEQGKKSGSSTKI